MTAPGLFVAIVRGGGLLFAVRGFIAAASTWGSGFPGRAGYVVAGFALALIGIGLLIAAPAIARLLPWPETPPDADPLEGELSADGVGPWWRVAARAVGLIAVVELISPLTRVARAAYLRENLLAGTTLLYTLQAVAFAVVAVVLLLTSRRRSASAPRGT